MERPLMAIGRRIWPVTGDPLRRNPSRAARPRPTEPGFERWMWYFTRISGLLLVVLAMGHMGIMHVLVQLTGQEISFAFVLERWGNPFWRIYDLLLLLLALTHGVNGASFIIGVFIERGGLRSLLVGMLLALSFVLLLLGIFVIVTFDPAGAPAIGPFS
jgi:succinate dehydrogenase / fumarate reductase membrane anchor subunit